MDAGGEDVERARTSERLRQQEEQYRAIFEATNDALIITDAHGFCVEANPAACRLYGYPYEEMVGLHAAAATHPDYHDLARAFLDAIRVHGSFAAESLALRKDGTPFHIETRASRFMYQGQPHILAVVRDVTERVRAREMLEQRVEERTRELSTLLAVSHSVASTLELRPLLGLILDQLKLVVDNSGSAVHVVEDEWLEMLEHRFPPGNTPGPARTPIAASHFWQTSLRHGEPVVIDDLLDDSPEAGMYRMMLGDQLEAALPYVRSYLAMPLVLRDRVMGALVISHQEPGYFTPRCRELLAAIAGQAAVAIENARLYERARELAAVEERQRLARELHDSVSQALYGIALGVQTARTLLDRDPTRVAEPLDYALALAQTGLAEMRALIFELRPEALAAQGLVGAVNKQIAALQTRHGIAIAEVTCPEPEATAPVKEALYRIAQEAMYNAVKHAAATAVEVWLEASDDRIVLSVRDDGRGFDPRGSFPGHLGLHTMRERATRLGGTLEVESTAERGTHVRAVIPIGTMGEPVPREGVAT